jgi:dGTPase
VTHLTEAAALGHDLGHPPFGHVAEDELDNLVKKITGGEGYEGNAQSFRILTVLSVRRPGSKHALDLTCATLNATLKYPNLWNRKVRKYGAYKSEKQIFQAVRKVPNPGGIQAPSIEAQIMDWADHP